MVGRRFGILGWNAWDSMIWRRGFVDAYVYCICVVGGLMHENDKRIEERRQHRIVPGRQYRVDVTKHGTKDQGMTTKGRHDNYIQVPNIPADKLINSMFS
ncbi:hypothetical protein VTJ04DRAFT_2291 [Mycothermus thermophilus]|uniref:uncharacterized protein n=1 Tax=Humicola insolens TaxID=85995 RepID=UPI0037446DD4